MYYPTVHMHILLHLIYPPFTSMAYGYIKYSITTNPNVHEVFGILAPRFKTPTSVDDEFSVKPSRESIFQQCTKQNTKKHTCSPHHVHNFSVMFRLENQTLEIVFCFQKTPPFQLSVRFHVFVSQRSGLFRFPNPEVKALLGLSVPRWRLLKLHTPRHRPWVQRFRPSSSSAKPDFLKVFPSRIRW